MNTEVTGMHKRQTILIAEDSPTQAQRLQHILERNGYNVVVATNGRLALEAAQQFKPALLISDVVMPEMDGYELCSRFKSSPDTSSVPVILVTTLSDPQDVIRGLACRADNFILKPYDSAYLLSRVQFVLMNSHMRDSEQPGMGLEIFFNGQKHFITADRLQILNLLLSTYEAAIQRNKELSATQDELRETNLKLQDITLELEDRVLLRTRELEHTNEALRRAQQAVIQQERLSALGQMASGIAHDINNAISPIALYTESLLAREANLSTRAREQLVTIQRGIDDVAQTVARMREFYRPRAQQLRPVDLNINPLVQQVIDLTHARWKDQPQRRGIVIDLRTALLPTLPNVRGAEHEIRDALTNLIFNAVDAMPEGGTILVSTRVDGDKAVLEVRDGGIGMDEETRARCLEPFFTTKGERGTGLGLAMVYGMAQRHEALMEIDSEPGAGTTMRLLFPVSNVGTSVSDTVAMPRPSVSLRLLIVDDDPLLLNSLRFTLEEDGHRVTTANGGKAGIDAFRQALDTPDAFEIVITDMGMPHVGGDEVVASVRAVAPQTPVVLLSGWGQQPLPDSEVPLADRVLTKPPRLQDLRAVLAELAADL